MQMKQAFKNPPKEYRGAPFWSWNDRLEDAELIRQIKLMGQAGLGGFFMHARMGLVTPYMSGEWMRRIKTCVRTAGKLDMNAWLYDEDRWPSGFASGKVLHKDRRFARLSLQLLELPGKAPKPLKATGEVLAVFQLERKAGRITTARFVGTHPTTSAIGLKGPVAIVSKVRMKPAVKFNNQPYVDLLNPKAVQAFIESTYVPYRKAVGNAFGKQVPGIFTDEPNVGRYPWTEGFRQAFSQQFGYDIVPHLTSLFYRVGAYKKVRHDYFRLVTDRFVESFSKQLYRWCESAGIALTGHYLGEDSLQSQTSVVGAVMPHYEFQQLPGIDLLERKLNTIATCKQVSSVAHQLGDGRVLAEIFGASGWDLSLAEQRWKGDWACVLGVNLFCQHLALYCLRGERKRDFPPSIHYQQPWWKHYRALADYRARLCYMLTRGQFQAEALVLHPIGSAWATYSAQEHVSPVRRRSSALSEQFEELLGTLCQVHYDFDLGDETILAHHGRVQKGKLHIGSMRYKLVVLPPSLTWRQETVRLLTRFLDAGGKVIAIRPTPTMVEAEPSPHIRRLLAHPGVNVIRLSRQSLRQVLEKSLVPKVKMEGAQDLKDIYYQHRLLPGKHIFFFTNTNFDRGYHARLALKASGRAEKWDLETGRISPLPSRRQKGYTIIDVEFCPAGSLLLVMDESRPASRCQTGKLQRQSRLVLANRWQIASAEPNALTIDHCRFRIGQGRWSPLTYVLDAQDELLRRGDNFSFAVRYEFDTRFAQAPPGNLKLALESPTKYQIFVNGRRLHYRDTGWWRDQAFKLIDISAEVKNGRTLVELRSRFRRPTKPGTLIFTPAGTEVEACYLIGNFAVVEAAPNKFIITDEPGQVSSGDLTGEGFPFFAGALTLAQQFTWHKRPGERVFLKLENMTTTAVEVALNHRQAGVILWRPWQVELTKLLKQGNNTLTLELTNSCRNLLGPHHHTGAPLSWTGPSEFRDKAHWSKAYNLVPFGLGGKVSLVRYTLNMGQP